MNSIDASEHYELGVTGPSFSTLPVNGRRWIR